MPRLFHFSENDSIEIFEPRPVRVPSVRRPGMDWLNGPLVWAIEDWHQPMFFFSRDCPRILMWRKEGSTGVDVQKYIDASTARMVAYIERGWVPALQSQTLYRYELPSSNFVSLDDAGMWVAKIPVTPIARQAMCDLPGVLVESVVELRVLDSLVSLRDAWSSSLHVSGIRLRNAIGWHM